jgi:hypothetical protein
VNPLSDAALAAVFTPDPGHPLTRGGLLGFLAVVAGCAIDLIGLYAAVITWRGLEPSRRRAQMLPITLTGGFFMAVGLAVAAFGRWIL